MSTVRVARKTEPTAQTEAASAARLAADVHLARFLLRPADYIDASRFDVSGLAGTALAAMNANAAFRKPVNAGLADMLFPPKVLGDAGLTRLPETRIGRLAALLLVAPMDRLRRIAALLAAGAVCRQITALILAADRRLASDAMGDEAFRFAVEEAPMMFAELSSGAAKLEFATRAQYAGLADDLLLSFVGAAVPAVKPLLELRFPVSTVRVGDGVIGAGQGPSVLRLIMRKEPAWSAFIA